MMGEGERGGEASEGVADILLGGEQDIGPLHFVPPAPPTATMTPRLGGGVWKFLSPITDY